MSTILASFKMGKWCK